MRRATDNQQTRFIIRTHGRHVGASDNIRHHNCDTLQTATIVLARAMADPKNFKVEFLAVLEVFVAD